jgi:outer membrane scaffolding protein for murein synthesis (MipA/OmpV family)
MCTLRIEVRLARVALMVACGISVGPMPLWAQSLPEQEVEQEGLAGKPEEGQFTGALGAGLVSRPRYQGADTSRVRLAPLVLLRYGNVFFGPLGLGWAAIHTDDFRAGPVLGYEGGRRESADPHLYGLGDIRGSITGGAFATYRFEPFEIGATVRQSLTHRDNGLNGFVRFEYVLQIVPHEWDFRIGPHLDFADAVYEQTQFGVSTIQSEQSGLLVFTPGGGLRDVGLRASLTYISTDHLVLRAFAGISKFMGDAADSPIVLSRTQHFIGSGIAYHF